ncbi:galactocerebrosidase-like [Haliotis cracherodii]|uniref:galactocerebrosidase-like n=1 Tax=Haliotis cracherodii TaxID=6455 RepID=UPI0039E84B68
MYLHVFVASFCFVIGSGDPTPGKYTIDDTPGYGRGFDGIGAISGGGATSKQLPGYMFKYQDEIFDFLFKPNFGASLQILKVEIGGDAQSSEGTEASHMHNSWDENYYRGYEWWIMEEAKKRNPNIKLYGLPWAFPGWVGNGSVHDPWGDPQLTVDYVVKWIQGAKVFHHLDIDYIGIWNERPHSVPYIKLLRRTLDQRNLTSVRIVAADGFWGGIVQDILQDSELADAVDSIGTHYPGTLSPREAVMTGKQLWASEDYGSFNDEIGGGCWARTLNMNYVNGLMTSSIAWCMVTGFYYPLPWYRDALMTANRAWDNSYTVNTPIWITAHTTQFTEIGWHYLAHGSGVGNFSGGGSYVSLVSPDGKNLTIVIETMSHDHSVCTRPPLSPYTVSQQNVTLVLKGSFRNITTLNVWRTRFQYGGKASTVFRKLRPVKVRRNRVKLQLLPDEVYTLTTMPTGNKGSFPSEPTQGDFPFIYLENFEGYSQNSEPFTFAQQMGSFEVIYTGVPHKNVLRQMVLQEPVSWCSPETQIQHPLNIVGDYNWTDVSVEMEIKLGDVNGSNGYFLAVRVDRGGCNSSSARGVFLYIYPSQKQFVLSADIGQTSTIMKGSIETPNPGWNKVSLKAEGNYADATFNDVSLMHVQLPSGPANGFVGLGTSSWGLADFDNMLIQPANWTSTARTQEDSRLYFKPGQ